MRRAWILLVLLVVLVSGMTMPVRAAVASPGATVYKKMCNASAAVSVADDQFVVADDEDKAPTQLRLYRTSQGGEPLSETPIPTEILDLDTGDLEVDIEGSARVGDHVYWIGSHSANKKGLKQPNRHRLFSTRLHIDGEQLTIKRVGKPYKDLIHDLDTDNRYAPFHLKDAARKKPKKLGALSIEGLASTPDGELLIGFRNPIPMKRALVARLKNPLNTIAGQPAEFGKPIMLDLGGLGIRSMERRGDNYFIIAGQFDDGQDFKLYSWSGDSNQAPQVIPGINLGGLNPEALFFDAVGAYVLSDDGKLLINGINCESLSSSQKRFRGVRLSLSH